MPETNALHQNGLSLDSEGELTQFPNRLMTGFVPPIQSAADFAVCPYNDYAAEHQFPPNTYNKPQFPEAARPEGPEDIHYVELIWSPSRCGAWLFTAHYMPSGHNMQQYIIVGLSHDNERTNFISGELVIYPLQETLVRSNAASEHPMHSLYDTLMGKHPSGSGATQEVVAQEALPQSGSAEVSFHNLLRGYPAINMNSMVYTDLQRPLDQQSHDHPEILIEHLPAVLSIIDGTAIELARYFPYQYQQYAIAHA